MEITDYTSYREIRTVCGLTEHDISDDMLSDSVFSDRLYAALVEVSLPDDDPGPGDLSTRFDEITATDVLYRTDKEKVLLIYTRLLATYAVASVVCESISLSAAKMRSDGKTVDTRFATDLAIKLTRDTVFSAAAKYKLAIENINDSATISYELITVASPSTDVVTND